MRRNREYAGKIAGELPEPYERYARAQLGWGKANWAPSSAALRAPLRMMQGERPTKVNVRAQVADRFEERFMIYFLRSATIAQGKMVSAMSFAREIAEFIKKKTGLTVTVGMPVGGQASRIGWFVEYENLAQLDETQTKLLQDAEYLALTTKGAENFVAGSLADNIWRVIK
jgi:hypothetical protein